MSTLKYNNVNLIINNLSNRVIKRDRTKYTIHKFRFSLPESLA